MKKVFQKLIGVLLVAAYSSCSKTDFSDVSALTNASKSEVPQDPVVPINPVVPISNFKLSNGVCNQDSSTNVLSCLKCNVPQIKQTPQLSVKAQALVDVMLLACPIPNKSDLTAYKPTQAQLINKLNRGSEMLYPETTRTSLMSLVIQGLTNPNDASLRQKMFGGLWYKPPYSDAFETYFGLTVQEAVSTFCWDGNKDTPKITGVSGLYSKEWLDCQYGSQPFSCQELPSYVLALGYRSQLQNVLSLSITNPYVSPIPDPQKKCTWDKFEGNNIVEAKKQFKKWLAEGRKLSMEIKSPAGVGSCGIADEKSLVEGATVTIASYICQ